MDFDYSPKTKELQAKLTQFMEDYIYPAEKDYAAEMAANTAAGKRWTPLQTIEQLKPKAQAAGLWNLFLPVDTAEASGYHGAGLTNAEYAPLAEIMGRIFWSSEVFNCNAPDTGNMEILHMFATPEQRERFDVALNRWLKSAVRADLLAWPCVRAEVPFFSLGCEDEDIARYGAYAERQLSPEVLVVEAAEGSAAKSGSFYAVYFTSDGRRVAASSRCFCEPARLASS